jgi:hypothetical protein
MWRLKTSSFVLAAVLAVEVAPAQELRTPYGPYDAIADGVRSNESRNLSLIDGQLDHVDRLRSLTVPVAGPRVFAGDPRIVGVYPYGRRGILGLRPQGYVVVRRTPVVVYRRTVVAPPTPLSPYESGDLYGYGLRESSRQPIGHESLQTGSDRWEYRPLYADDDRLDEMHREIERNLRPSDEAGDEPRSGFVRGFDRRAAARIPAANEPEELPTPDDVERPARRVNSRQAVGRAMARDIARDEEPAASADNADDRGDSRVPPPPQPDPPEQLPESGGHTNSAANEDRAKSKSAKPGNDELRGPLLQNPSSGTREF